MRHAKIVCTIGPATSSAESLRELVRSGMDVARFNLSHGEYSEHERIYHDVRRASDEIGRAVGILVDLQGPKIRTGRFEDNLKPHLEVGGPLAGSFGSAPCASNRRRASMLSRSSAR